MSSVYQHNASYEEDPNLLGQEDDIPLESIVKLDELQDGSSVYRIMDGQEEQLDEEAIEDFHENIAKRMDAVDLSSLGARLLEEIESDIEARKEWEETNNIALKNLGWKVEEFRDTPFVRACSAYDSTMAKALLSFFSVARAELFPAMGPAKTQIVGIPTDQSEQEAERVKLFINHYLTRMDKDYYPDSELLLMYIGLFGSAFRKVYQDPILNRPIGRAIKPQDLIVDPHTQSLLSSSRITHRIYLTKKEIILRGLSGEFIRDSLPRVADDGDDNNSEMDKTVRKMEGVSTESVENKSLFTYYECHVELDSDDIPNGNSKKVKKKSKKDSDGEDDLPKPYIVMIGKDKKKVVSIRRNWKQGDPSYTRRECFNHYYYLRGFGIYGIGLAHLLGSNSITLTSIQRQLIDAGTLKNFPGGLRRKGLRIENNDKAIGPGEFHEVETGEMAIQDTIMLMPYAEPSATLAALRTELKDETANLAATAETAIPELRANASEGTVLAMLEVANRMQSSILRSLHFSLGNELELFFNLFGEYLPDEPYPFAVPGSNSAIMRQDFNDRINIIPVSDPNVLTSSHRLLRNEALLKLAQSAPQLHNLREAYHRMYESMNVENIDKLLPPEQEAMPLDPITENINAMRAQALKVGLDQDHESHNIVHGQFMQQLSQMGQQGMDVQNAAAVLSAHIKEHISAKYLIDMQVSMGYQMPDGQMLLNPEVQNSIAVQAAQAVMQQQQAQAEQQPQPLDPNMVMLADIEQRREASHLHNEEAKMKTEMEAFKSQLNFESEKAKIEAQQEMAQDKNEVALTIANIKKPNHSE